MAQEYVPDSARESLVDIRDVKLDSSMEQADRVRSFIQQVKNPYRFKVGDVVGKCGLHQRRRHAE